MKGHISATKGSMTSKIFEVFLTNLTLESLKCVTEERGAFYQKTNHL